MADRLRLVTVKEWNELFRTLRTLIRRVNQLEFQIAAQDEAISVFGQTLLVPAPQDTRKIRRNR